MVFDNKYRRERNKKNYDLIQIFLKKDDNLKDEIKKLSDEEGISNNKFIITAIEEKIKKEKI